MFERVQEQSAYSFVVLARFGLLGAKTYMSCVCSHTNKKNQIDNAQPCTRARMQKKCEEHVYRNLSLCVHHFVNIRTQFLVDMLKRMRMYPLFCSGPGTSDWADRSLSLFCLFLISDSHILIKENMFIGMIEMH